MNDQLAAALRSDCALAATDVTKLAKLRGQRLLVTGGTGFMGSWVAEMVAYLNDEHGFGIDLLLLAPTAESFAQRVPHLGVRSDVTLIEEDVRDITTLPEGVTYVLHAAGTPDNRVHVTDPLRTMSTIARGTSAILQAAAASVELQQGAQRELRPHLRRPAPRPGGHARVARRRSGAGLDQRHLRRGQALRRGRGGRVAQRRQAAGRHARGRSRSSARIRGSTSRGPSTTSFATRCWAGRSASWATPTPSAATCIPATWRSGCSPSWPRVPPAPPTTWAARKRSRWVRSPSASPRASRRRRPLRAGRSACPASLASSRTSRAL